jgi:outer membrane lipoprotein-sorting protein
MAGIRRASIAVLLSCLVAGISVAGISAVRAQDIPLPKPAPQPKDRSTPTPAQKDVPPPPSAQAPAPAAPSFPNPLTAPLTALNNALNPFSHPSSDLSLFDDKQRALVTRVSTYLSGVQTLTGKFVQIGPDGRRTTGHLFLQKPGRVRFEYDPPTPIDIVADGSQVAVSDRQLGTHDLYPLSQTPLRFLLADHIDLLQDTNVVSVTADNGFVTVVIEEKQPFVGTNRLSMMFDPKDFRLRQWTITDVQGLDTTIAVSNLDTSKRPDPNLFRIDFQRVVQ